MTTSYDIKYKRIEPGLYGTGLVSDHPSSEDLSGEVELVLHQISRGYWVAREYSTQTQTLGAWQSGGWTGLADAKAGMTEWWLTSQSDDGKPRILAEEYTAKYCEECEEWIYVDRAPFAEGGDRTKPLRDIAHYEAHHADKCREEGVVTYFPYMHYNKEPVHALVEDVRMVAGNLMVMGVNSDKRNEEYLAS